VHHPVAADLHDRRPPVDTRTLAPLLRRLPISSRLPSTAPHRDHRHNQGKK
jgi:hypothetical protein